MSEVTNEGVVTKPHPDEGEALSNFIGVSEEVLAELEGQAKHERLQSAESRLRRLLPSAKAALSTLLGTVLMLILACSVAVGQITQPLFPPNNNAQPAVTGPAGAVTNPSAQLINVSPGPVFCNGALSFVHNTQFNLVGANAVPAVVSANGQSLLFWVYYRCSTDQVLITTTAPVLAIDVPFATVLQSNAAGSLSFTITDIRSAALFPNSGDWVIPFGPGDCAWNATGTLGATTSLNLQAIGANFAEVNDIATTAAGPTVDNLTCNVHLPTRTSTGKGISISDCTIFYGVQTTALTSMGAPTLNTITMPTPGTSETPSTVAPVSLGAVTVTPVVGSANLGTTTAGAFFSEKVALNTPVFLNTDVQSVQYNQTFNQSASAAQVVNTPGGVCHGTFVAN